MKKVIWTKPGTTREQAEFLFTSFISWWGTSGNPILLSLSDSWYGIAIDEDRAEGVWEKFQAAIELAKQTVN